MIILLPCEIIENGKIKMFSFELLKIIEQMFVKTNSFIMINNRE